MPVNFSSHCTGSLQVIAKKTTMSQTRLSELCGNVMGEGGTIKGPDDKDLFTIFISTDGFKKLKLFFNEIFKDIRVSSTGVKRFDKVA